MTKKSWSVIAASSLLLLTALALLATQLISPHRSFQSFIGHRLSSDGDDVSVAQENPVGEAADLAISIRSKDVYVSVGSENSNKGDVVRAQPFDGVTAELLERTYPAWRFQCKLRSFLYEYDPKSVVVAYTDDPQRDIPKIHKLLKCVS